MQTKPLIGRFLRDETGTFTVLSLYFTAIAMIVGGLAIDYSNRTAKQTRLQTAVDAVGHAALLTKLRGTGDAQAKALEIATSNLPDRLHGDAILAEDIVFGYWDDDAAEFVPDPHARDAVQVTARRNVARDNIVTNLMLQAIGYDGFEVETDTVFDLWEPPCFLNGFMADQSVDIQGNNQFGPYFCLHGNTHVKLSSNNGFDPGAIVSMPIPEDLQLPSSGFDSNADLAEALRYSYYPFNILNRLDDIVAELLSGGEALPDYIVGLGPIALSGNKLAPEDFETGRIHTMLNCSGNQQVTLDPGLFSGFVFVTNCKVKFNQGVALEDVVIATTNDDPKSFNSPSGLTLGRPDDCAPGGGVALLTYGGFEVASDLKVHGSQVVARGSITFSAQAQGIQGVSMIAGGNIDSTSNIDMNGCPPEGMDPVTLERVVRMVR
ncbi:pilus assembly protein TadG-related protein [Aestuariicoccus sp. MJ-SS9]|uniref:TadE/TadG family type IV pilus assembly protein n=1 Tax=Aestuariicoccus sp. MJ-SS9 TaxID=3079855 RepID=UPI002911A5BF|nr:pilus assembly protein TadG-related protein [Aestuariicoccus sp. MJ-SS9]MDU8911225.1 pilus assembly protein TadG-related protein [Aestuariicoccus sp. MJ-SS9]